MVASYLLPIIQFKLPYEVREITPGDGNCFFWALLDHLKTINHEKSRLHHLELRRQIVDFIRRNEYEVNSELFRNELFQGEKEDKIVQISTGNDIYGSTSWNEYLEKSKQDTVYIETTIIRATAIFLNTDLWLTSVHQDLMCTEETPWAKFECENGLQKKPFTFVYIHGRNGLGGHFQSIHPKENVRDKCFGCNKNLQTSIEYHLQGCEESIRIYTDLNSSQQPILNTQNKSNIETNSNSHIPSNDFQTLYLPVISNLPETARVIASSESELPVLYSSVVKSGNQTSNSKVTSNQPQFENKKLKDRNTPKNDLRKSLSKEEKLEQRREKDRLRKAAMRKNETPDEKRLRLNRTNELVKQKRQNEDDDVRELRLERNRESKNRSLQKETAEAREKRLFQMKEYQTLKQANETPDEKRQRLHKNKISKGNLLKRVESYERYKENLNTVVPEHVKKHSYLRKAIEDINEMNSYKRSKISTNLENSNAFHSNNSDSQDDSMLSNDEVDNSFNISGISSLNIVEPHHEKSSFNNSTNMDSTTESDIVDYVFDSVSNRNIVNLYGSEETLQQSNSLEKVREQAKKDYLAAKEASEWASEQLRKLNESDDNLEFQDEPHESDNSELLERNRDTSNDDDFMEDMNLNNESADDSYDGLDIQIETQRTQNMPQKKSSAFKKAPHNSKNNPTKKSKFSQPKALMNYDPTYDYSSDPWLYIGGLSNKCKHCGVLRFINEPNGICCQDGAVKMPNIPPPLQPIKSYIEEKDMKFFAKSRMYNASMSMTSFGATKEIFDKYSWPMCKIQGQVFHRIGSLLPKPGEKPTFLQIFFIDDYNNQADIRMNPPFGTLEREKVLAIQKMLHENNRLVKEFKTAVEKQRNVPNYHVVISAEKRPQGAHPRQFNEPSTNDVAALVIGGPNQNRDIVIHSRDAKLTRVSDTHILYDALQYPLIFCEGQDGFNLKIPVFHTRGRLKQNVSMQSYYAYYFMIREDPNKEIDNNRDTAEDLPINWWLSYGKLTNQFVVDAMARIEYARLKWYENNQTTIRAEMYQNVQDYDIADLEVNPNSKGKRIILGDQFTGGPRYLNKKKQDAYVLSQEDGTADFFITFTCNPGWEEIRNIIGSDNRGRPFPYEYRHDIVARVFEQKLRKFVDILTKRAGFGEMKNFVFRVEWQKRGNPHIHFLLWLMERIHASEVDNVIRATIPDPKEDPELHQEVLDHMVHGPCDVNPGAYLCRKNGKCEKGFPKPFRKETQINENGYPEYARPSVEDGGHIGYKYPKDGPPIVITNQWIVPYNPVLLKMFKAHINLEWCCSIKVIQYILKYICKGQDSVMAGFSAADMLNEIKRWLHMRCITTPEAFWSIFEFAIHDHFPAVQTLAIHDENNQVICWNPNNPEQVKTVFEKPGETTLTAYFKECQKENSKASEIIYRDMPKYYTWDQKKKIWNLRQRGYMYGRIVNLKPNTRVFYIRLLLNHVPGPKSFQDLRTVNGNLCETYKQACELYGLTEADNHLDLVLDEAIHHSNSHQLRQMFAMMLTQCEVSNPNELWNKYKEQFCSDLLHHVQKDARREDQTAQVQMNGIIENNALVMLENLVEEMGGSKFVGIESDEGISLPKTIRYDANVLERPMYRELDYNLDELNNMVEENVPKLMPEQRNFYETVMKSVNNKESRVFFLNAPGGTGKTFVLNLILAEARKNRKIALAVASTGIAATLLDGGRTAHSMFKIPVPTLQNSVCNIYKGSAEANLFKNADVIIWDECVLQHKFCPEKVDQMLRDVCDNEDLFGGITVVFAGDFRQILPIVERGTPADEIEACLKSSYIWRNIEQFSLTVNMRAYLKQDQSTEEFCQNLMKIGNGQLLVNPEHNLHELPCGTFLCDPKEREKENKGKSKKSTNENNSQNKQKEPTLLERVFPNLKENYRKEDWLKQRAILSPINDIVEKTNLEIIKRLPGKATSYPSIDRVIDNNEFLQYPIELLNSQNPKGMPVHNIVLKEGAIIMMTRNLNQPKLCNGTRLIVKKLLRFNIIAKIIDGPGKGEEVFLFQINLNSPENYPIKFKRKQFPIKPCAAMTINKSQGQSYDVVGLDLMINCFSHGQLYVGCSRVGSAKDLYIQSNVLGFTKNVVYSQVLDEN